MLGALAVTIVALIVLTLLAMLTRYLCDRYAKHRATQRDLLRDAQLWRAAEAKRRYEIDEMSMRAIADYRRDEAKKRRQRADYDRMCRSVVDAVNAEARRAPVVRELATVLSFHDRHRAPSRFTNDGDVA